MSGIPTPAAIGDASRWFRDPLVEAVKKQLGVVPNPVPSRLQQPRRACKATSAWSSALSKGRGCRPRRGEPHRAWRSPIGFPRCCIGTKRIL